jgi:1-phosphofructokinase family hexose kinase
LELKPQFVCVSANPAIDKRARATKLQPGAVNRLREVVPEPGGKAAHVALGLAALGESPLWIGFAGAANGRELVAGLNAEGIETRCVEMQSPTRVNLAILDEAGVVTEVLEPGGAVSESEVRLFLETCNSAFAAAGGNAQVIFSGSLPPGAPQDFYSQLICAARSAGCKTFLDTSGTALELGLQSRPDVAKPNKEEAELLTGKAITGINDAQTMLQQILTRGAGGVALSLGRDGLLWCPGKNQPIYWARTRVVEARSAVGSGDATLAGLAEATAQGFTTDEAAKFAAACGAANCLAASPGRIRQSDVQELMKATLVEKLA